MTFTNVKFGTHIAMELDLAAVGTHTLVGTAPSLGLILEGGVYLSEGRWKEVQPEEDVWRNTKATTKIRDRMRLFGHPATSVVGKSIAFSMYIYIYISILPYFSSYHGFVASDVHKLNGLAQSLILGRAWIRRDLLSHVFRWLRIAPLCDPAIALTLATVGLYVRKGGCVRALLPLARATAARQDQVLLRVWTPWITMITIPELFRAVECFLHSSAPRYKQQRGQQ